MPGSPGEDGSNGAAGSNGVSAFTTFTAIYTIPASDGASSAVATVVNTSWMAIGQKLYGTRVDGSVHAFLQVTAIGSATSVTLLNLENTATSAYLDNSAPATTLNIGSVLLPAGIQGPAGVIGASSAVGGDLKGSYPNLVFLNKPNVLGDILVGNGTDAQVLNKGADGTSLVSDAAAALDVTYKQIVPITGDTDVLIDRVARLSATTGLPIPIKSSRMAIRDAGGAGTLVVDDRAAVGNARGADSIDLQTSRNAVTQVASGTESVLGGGRRNTAAATQSTIAGGDTNSIEAGAQESFIGGGMSNLIQALGERGVIAGGDTNVLSGPEAVIGGGNLNVAAAQQCVIAGGDANSIALASTESVIGGGNGNAITTNGLSVIAGGSSNAASGTYATIGGGRLNQATGTASCVPGGIGALADKNGQVSHSGGSFAAAGDAQTSVLVARNNTANATPAELFLDGAALRCSIAVGSSWLFEIRVVARTSAGLDAIYTSIGVIRNVAGTTSVNAVTTTEVFDGATLPVTPVAVTADDANDALVITVTGIAATLIRWVASIRLTEVSYP